MQTSRLLLSAALVASLVGAGCPSSDTATETGASPSESERSGSAPVAAGSSLCNHPYYPLKAGYQVAYKTSGSGKDMEYVFDVKEASGNTVKAQYTFPVLGTLDLEMECEGGNIRAKSYLDLGSISAGTRIQSETKRVVGELLPAVINVGTTWENEFDVEATIQNEDMQRMGMGTMDMTIKAAHKVLGEESVTVPAGSYQALKVESISTVGIVMGGRAPIETVTTSTEYWVKGVGMVKTFASSGSGEWGVEAQSVRLP